MLLLHLLQISLEFILKKISKSVIMWVIQNPFNLIFDKISKFIDDVINLNNLRKWRLSLDKHFLVLD